MYTITKLKMWKDPGYTRECVEVPPAGSRKLPAPDYSSTAPMRPRKSQIMDELQLSIPYLQVLDMSYLYIEAQDGATPANTISMFGWILSVEESASAESACTIRWTPDWWRTYSGTAQFGTGIVTRCNDATLKRPYQTQPRMWKVKHKELLNPLSNFEQFPKWYVIVSYNEREWDAQSGEYVVTSIQTIYWLAGISSGETVTIGGITYTAPSIAEVFTGQLDDVLGIDPAAINSIFISPIPPEDPVMTQGGTLRNNNRFAYRAVFFNGTAVSRDTTNIYTSNDMLKTVIVEPSGSIVYTLPWGYSIDHLELFLDVGTVSSNVDVALRSKTSTEKGSDLGPTGRLATIPLPNAPYNSNGYSSYNYSGHRDYDIRVKEIQRDEKAIAGMSNVAMSAAGGAMVGKGTGAVIGAGVGAAGLAIDYAMTGIFNDELQKEQDKLYANQTPTILQTAGGGGSYVTNMTAAMGWYIIQLEADDVSATEYTNHVTNEGYTTELSTATASCITAGGPLQIQNLMITGSIPPAAKTYIKNILSNGIRIVENNPTGTDPGA